MLSTPLEGIKPVRFRAFRQLRAACFYTINISFAVVFNLKRPRVFTGLICLRRTVGWFLPLCFLTVYVYSALADTSVLQALRQGVHFT